MLSEKDTELLKAQITQKFSLLKKREDPKTFKETLGKVILDLHTLMEDYRPFKGEIIQARIKHDPNLKLNQRHYWAFLQALAKYQIIKIEIHNRKTKPNQVELYNLWGRRDSILIFHLYLIHFTASILFYQSKLESRLKRERELLRYRISKSLTTEKMFSVSQVRNTEMNSLLKRASNYFEDITTQQFEYPLDQEIKKILWPDSSN